MKHFPAALILAILVSACGGPGSRSLTPPSTPAATHVVSGVIAEMTPAGLVPVEGVRVEEATSRQAATTDRTGFFSMSGVPAVHALFSARKDGYQIVTKDVQINGDTRLDMEIVRLVSYTLSGVAFEVTATGQSPLEGVEVYCDGCGSPVGHTFAYTNEDGFYSFSWAFNGATPLLVTKAGYDVLNTVGTFPGQVVATVNGDTRFDLKLVRR